MQDEALSSTLHLKYYLTLRLRMLVQLHKEARPRNSTDLYKMIRHLVTCRRHMTTFFRNVVSTLTWLYCSRCSTCKISTIVNLRVSVNSRRSPSLRYSSLTQPVTRRCAKRLSHIYSHPTSIGSSPMLTTCSSSRSNSPNTMPSIHSSPTSSTKQTSKNLDR